ncbi:MAG: M23 family metallopeptidase [Bacteroidota bacterium]
MKQKWAVIVLAFAIFGLGSCKKENPYEQYEDQINVCINDVPYKTEAFLRIPYTLEFWEYKNSGMLLQKIYAYDKESMTQLMEIDTSGFPRMYYHPLESNHIFTFDSISHYYMSLQLPILLAQTPPGTVIHRFEFKDTVNNETVMLEGAEFEPRLTEPPLVIASPVKGTNHAFINQSTNGYHFNAMFFMDGGIYTSERFAFDELQVNDELTTYFDGDPKKNESYFNYRDTLFAVADGTVVQIEDGLPENNGDAQNITFTTSLEYAGNLLVLDIGSGHYAFYGHCVPNSFLVNVNDVVQEGDPIALIGNSGNSTAPHLHFQITDGPGLFKSTGLPFVLEKYTKIGDITGFPVFITPQKVTNSMMEQFSVISFD